MPQNKLTAALERIAAALLTIGSASLVFAILSNLP